MYIFWVLCFTGTIYMTREGTQSYQFANLFQSWLIDNDGWLDRCFLPVHIQLVARSSYL